MNIQRWKVGFGVALFSLCLGNVANAQYSPAQALPGFDMSMIARAIRSMNGYAEGVIQGAQAKALQGMTRSNEPLFVSVKVLQRFKQFECARVEINVTQEKVPTTSGQFVTFRMPPVGMNICTDGNPPDGRVEDLPKGNWEMRRDMFESGAR
jgi:hypothetical protein